jgi:predicted RND superfamily exporter protein
MTTLLNWGIDRPRQVLLVTALVTLGFLAQFPRAVIDTDPENMLETDQVDRAFYAQVKEDFGIFDLIVVGVSDPDGIFRVETLQRLDRIADGIVAIDGVIVEDVLSLSTTDNVTSGGGLVEVARIMEAPPDTEAEAAAIRDAVFGNEMFTEKLVSLDGTAAAFYVPIERKDESHRIAGEIEAIMARELGPGQRSYIAGLPVAEDTFGFEMFLQMGIMAPLAMLVIFGLLFVMFRSLALIVPPLAVAMLSVIWGMGALIGGGFTVHIMSSMIPIFLMPIAVLDSVHVLSEFHDLYPSSGDRAATLRRVMRELFKPMLFTSLTSAAGFASLLLAPIPPVRVFGAFVAFGILAAWFLTITVVPAAIMLAPAASLRSVSAPVGEGASSSWLERWVPRVGGLAHRRSGLVVLVSVLLLVVGVIGLSRIEVNDNPVRWFKAQHTIRVADDAMNRLFGGTYMADLILDGVADDTMKRPEVMRFIDALQTHLEQQPLVGKTASVADVVRRVRYVMHDGDPAMDAVPSTQEEIAQFLFLFQMSGDPNDLDNFVDYDYRRANIWVQLKEGDNQDIEALAGTVEAFVAEHPLPDGVSLRWSGLAYINKVWQDLMVVGMRDALIGGFVTVFLLMWVLFRSAGLAAVSMVPLTFAIAVSYGIVGWVGKDYDMPIAVCSSLALGLSVDFAIHFVQRYREQWARLGDAQQVADYMFGAPGRAIARNAVVIVVGFLPLVLATLTPYVTVGLFFAVLMSTSAVATLLLLPALMKHLGPRLCGGAMTPSSPHS